MANHRKQRCSIAAGICGACLCTAALAGDLVPPAGPVSPTMKDLVDVEPRAAIRNDFDTLTPIVISQSGSYYLAENIDAFFGQHGIEITASDVTLDLNGFRVLGNTEVGSIDGIVTTVSVRNIVVKNGTVSAFIDGLDLGSAVNSSVHDVRVEVVSGQGVRVGAGSTVERCSFNSILGTGFLLDLGSVATGCTAKGGATGFSAFGANTLASCSAHDSTGVGFSAGEGTHLTSCVTRNCGSDGFRLGNDCSAEGCLDRNAGEDGFDVNPGCVLTGCNAQNAADSGFNAALGGATFDRCVAEDSPNGFGFILDDDSVLMDCVVRDNFEGALGGHRCTVIRCTFVNNGTAGVRLFGDDGAIRDCTATDNTGFGFTVSPGTGNTIVGNVSSPSGGGYNIAGGNHAGTIVASPVGAGAWDNLDL